MIYRFAGFELDDARFELRRDGAHLHLPPKCFDLLLYLLRSAGRVVSRDELHSAIWPGEAVSDYVLPVYMRTIRKTLGEDRQGAIIQTVRRRGYSILCPIEQLRHSRPAVAPRARLGIPPFVGRAPLMEELGDALRAAVSGEGRIVLLHGEAGIGKTRVLEEFAKFWLGGPSPVLVASIRCEESSGAPPFWALQQLLRAGRNALAGGELAALASRHDYDIERATARLRALLQPDPGDELGRDVIRFQLIRAVLQVVEEVASMAPVVLVVDDLHCMDEGSLRVWEALARAVRGWRVLLLAAYRDADLPADASVRRLLAAIATEPGLREIAVRPFDVDAVVALVHGVFDVQPEASLVRALLERTEGNPFFLREFLSLLSAEGSLREGAGVDLGELDLPPAGREVIQQRLRGVSASCLSMLEWAAVIGRVFSLRLLERVSGVDSSRLLELLCEGADAHIIDPDAGPGRHGRFPLGHYGFAHGLIREALYTRLSRPERALRHRAVGEAIEGMVALDGTARIYDLAYHFLQAVSAGEVERAAAYAVQAARRAVAVFAYEDAVWHLENALRVEELRWPADPERACAVELGLADALRGAGRYAAASATYLRVASAARSLGRPDLLTQAAIGLMKPLPLIRQGFTFAAGASSREPSQKTVLGLADEARLALGDTHEPLQARLLALYARVEASRAHTREASALSARALELARRSEDWRALFDALVARRASLQLPCEASEVLRLSGELIPLASGPDAKPLLFAAHEIQIPALIALGDIAGADRGLAVLRELARELCVPAYDYAVARFELARAVGDADLARATGLVRRVLELGELAGDPDAARYKMTYSWIACAEGRSAPIKPTIEAWSDADLIQGTANHILTAVFFSDAGQRQRCLSHYERAVRENFEDIPRDDDWLWLLCSAADVCARLLDRERAASLYQRIEPYGHLNVTSSLFIYMGSASLTLGRLAFLLRNLDAARAHYEAALQFNRRLGSTSALMFTQYEYGLVLQQGTQSERDRATRLLATAASLANKGGVLLMHGRPVPTARR